MRVGGCGGILKKGESRVSPFISLLFCSHWLASPLTKASSSQFVEQTFQLVCQEESLRRHIRGESSIQKERTRLSHRPLMKEQFAPEGKKPCRGTPVQLSKVKQTSLTRGGGVTNRTGLGRDKYDRVESHSLVLLRVVSSSITKQHTQGRTGELGFIG